MYIYTYILFLLYYIYTYADFVKLPLLGLFLYLFNFGNEGCNRVTSIAGF